MSGLDSRRIVGLLADETRRRIVAALILAEEPLSSAQVGERAGVSLRDAVDGLDRLQGLVEPVGDAWRLDGDVFQQAARSEASPAAPSEFADEPDDIAKVLDRAFADGKLVKFPTKRAKRLVVLDHLVQRFEIGRHYPEVAVNESLREVHDDVAMLRRWLVDEQFLDRSGGMYWRCGGSV